LASESGKGALDAFPDVRGIIFLSTAAVKVRRVQIFIEIFINNIKKRCNFVFVSEGK